MTAVGPGAPFAFLMLNQTIAFFRNMFVLLPFFAIAATWLVGRDVERLRRGSWLPNRAGAALAPTLVVVLAAQPALGAFDLWNRARTRPESRNLVSACLAENTVPDVETAVAADLQLPWPDYALPGVTSSGLEVAAVTVSASDEQQGARPVAA